MLGGQKPWVKILAENFLLNLTLLAILLTRIAGKIINKDFSIWNLAAFSVSIIGFVLLVISKKDQINRKEFFKFGSNGMSENDKKIYKISYFLMIIGLLITFTF